MKGALRFGCSAHVVVHEEKMPLMDQNKVDFFLCRNQARMNDREREKGGEREMSHLAIGFLKLTANQFRCEQLPKYRTPITFLKDEEGGEEKGGGQRWTEKRKGRTKSKARQNK